MRIPQLDRRVLYMMLAVVVAIPLLVNVPLPPPAITPPTRSFYETIEEFRQIQRLRTSLLSCPATLAQERLLKTSASWKLR